MQLATGTVVDGKIVLEGATLPEGTVVTVLARDSDETFELPPELEAELAPPSLRLTGAKPSPPRIYSIGCAASPDSSVLAVASLPGRSHKLSERRPILQ